MKCDSCMHNLVCEYIVEMRAFEDRLTELEKSMNLMVSKADISCKYYLEKKFTVKGVV